MADRVLDEHVGHRRGEKSHQDPRQVLRDRQARSPGILGCDDQEWASARDRANRTAFRDRETEPSPKRPPAPKRGAPIPPAMINAAPTTGTVTSRARVGGLRTVSEGGNTMAPRPTQVAAAAISFGHLQQPRSPDGDQTAERQLPGSREGREVRACGLARRVDDRRMPATHR